MQNANASTHILFVTFTSTFASTATPFFIVRPHGKLRHYVFTSGIGIGIGIDFGFGFGFGFRFAFLPLCFAINIVFDRGCVSSQRVVVFGISLGLGFGIGCGLGYFNTKTNIKVQRDMSDLGKDTIPVWWTTTVVKYNNWWWKTKSLFNGGLFVQLF